ncbi:HAD family hydrolase [Enterococcus alishanensis]
MKKFNGVIFDMDGLLFDTETIYYETQQVAADQFGLPFDKNIYNRYIGISDEEVWEDLHKVYAQHGKEVVNAFIEKSWGDAKELFFAGKVELKPGVIELLDYLTEQEIPKIVASSNVRSVIESLLEHAQIRDYFVDIVSADDVSYAKPDPEIFLNALGKLGTEAAKTLVLEDSKNGILAANSANIPVIMVPDLIPPTEELAEKTLEVLPSLHEVITYLKN